MFRTRKQSTTTYPVSVLMVSSTDHVTPQTGKTVTCTISKSGGAFASSAGAMSEVSAGIYTLAGNATDRNTLGSSVYKFSATGCDDAFVQVEIVPYDVFDVVDANTTKIAGTTQTARDIGASVLLSSGTSTGQISLSSGTVTTGAISANAITATSINSNAFTSAKFATGVLPTVALDTEISGRYNVYVKDFDSAAAGTLASSPWTYGTRTLTSLSGLTVDTISGIDAAGATALRASLGLAAADLDTQLDAIAAGGGGTDTISIDGDSVEIN